MVFPLDKGDRMGFTPQHDSPTRRGIVEHKGDLLGTVNGDASSPVCDYTVYRYGPGHSSKDATRYQHKTQEDKTGTHARLPTPCWWSNKKVRYKAHDNLQVLWLLLR